MTNYFSKTLLVSLILLSVVFGLYASEIKDLGQTETFTISAPKTADSGVNSSSVVFEINSHDIEQYHYESLADAVDSIATASMNRQDSLGTIQNANINGMGSGRTVVYLDGTKISTSYDNNFNLSTLPISAIEKIEVITSGVGKSKQAVAAGGIINIISKKSDGEPSLNISFENGSFLPAEKGFPALFDSQDLHATYTGKIKGQNVLFTIGGMRAANNYSYKAKDFGINSWTLQNNADTWAADFSASINGKIKNFEYASNNVIRYQHLAVPGSCTYATPKDFQNNLFVNTANTLGNKYISFHLNYSYSPVLIYKTQTSSDSHFKHNLSLKADSELKLTENIMLFPFAETQLEIAKSTSLEEVKLRFYPRIGFNSSLSFGNLVLFPMADIGFTTDMKKWFANASLGTEFTIIKNLIATSNFTFAHRLPTFSDLYWPFTDYGWGFSYKGNPNLKPEKSFSGDIGIKYNTEFFSTGFSFFTRWINDQILTSDDYSTMYNIDNALYLGFNADAKLTYKNLETSLGWFFNKSYNLTNGNSISDNVAVSNVRLHTLTFSLSYNFGKFALITDGKYSGKYFNASGEQFKGAFVWNVGVNLNISDNLKMYCKIDNILNTQYQFVYGYPMPGLKARIGGTWKIL